jgi:hypothetical protein
MRGTKITLATRQGRSITGELPSFLTPEMREQARIDANTWIKSFRHVPYDGAPMRQRFTYRGDSLWWFTEIYLHKMRRLDEAASVLMALERACDAESPVGLAVHTDSAVVRDASVAFAARRGLPLEVVGSQDDDEGLGWRSYQIGVTAELSRLRGSTRVEKKPAVAAFVHTAFWRTSPGAERPMQESYIGAVLDAVSAAAGDDNLYCVGVGPRRNFKARRWWDALGVTVPYARMVTPVERLAPRAALSGSLALWRERRTLADALTAGDGVRAAATHRGYDLWPIVRRELRSVAMLQWPWSARAMDEAGAALDALSPQSVLTYAEAGGWGRALMLEARRRNIPSVGLQHGFIYRHWLNYLHEPDEISPAGSERGCPIPDVTLLFDRYAEQHLRDTGHFPASSLRVTGNARLDQLVTQCGALKPMRDALRREFCSTTDQPLAVLAAKFNEIQGVLGDLAAAVGALPGMRLIIKPHPAETPDEYAAVTAATPNISIADAATDLARLLTAADAIVTMNSTVAIDGLVLGLPSLVIGLPNNLSPLVSAGAMLGANGAEDIRLQLHALLYDAEVRRKVTDAGAAFASRYELASDGQAARRTAEAILSRAGSPAQPSGIAEGL